MNTRNQELRFGEIPLIMTLARVSMPVVARSLTACMCRVGGAGVSSENYGYW